MTSTSPKRYYLVAFVGVVGWGCMCSLKFHYVLGRSCWHCFFTLVGVWGGLFSGRLFHARVCVGVECY